VVVGIRIRVRLVTMSEDVEGKDGRWPAWKWFLLACLIVGIVATFFEDVPEPGSKPVESETTQPVEVKPEEPAKPVEMVKKLSYQTNILYKTSGRLGDNIIPEQGNHLHFGEISCEDAFMQFRGYAQRKYSLYFEVASMSTDQLSYSFRDTRDRTFYIKARCMEAMYRMVPKE
jgi:hypothetical protein